MIDVDKFVDGLLQDLVCKKIVKLDNYKGRAVVVMPLHAFKHILRLYSEKARLASLAEEANADNLADLQILLWKLEKARKDENAEISVDRCDAG